MAENNIDSGFATQRPPGETLRETGIEIETGKRIAEFSAASGSSDQASARSDTSGSGQSLKIGPSAGFRFAVSGSKLDELRRTVQNRIPSLRNSTKPSKSKTFQAAYLDLSDLEYLPSGSRKRVVKVESKQQSNSSNATMIDMTQQMDNAAFISLKLPQIGFKQSTPLQQKQTNYRLPHIYVDSLSKSFSSQSSSSIEEDAKVHKTMLAQAYASFDTGRFKYWDSK